MPKQLSTLLAASVVALGLIACAQEPRAARMAPGTYEKTTRSTDAGGTTTERRSSTEVDVDEDGHRTTVVKSKTTKDPKGLFNKTTTNQSKQVIEE